MSDITIREIHTKKKSKKIYDKTLLADEDVYY